MGPVCGLPGVETRCGVRRQPVAGEPVACLVQHGRRCLGSGTCDRGNAEPAVRGPSFTEVHEGESALSSLHGDEFGPV